jgi:hypothetical protein
MQSSRNSQRFFFERVAALLRVQAETGAKPESLGALFHRISVDVAVMEKMTPHIRAFLAHNTRVHTRERAGKIPAQSDIRRARIFFKVIAECTGVDISHALEIVDKFDARSADF